MTSSVSYDEKKAFAEATESTVPNEGGVLEDKEA